MKICILCGQTKDSVVCGSCRPSLTFTGTCPLCRTTAVESGKRTCLGCEDPNGSHLEALSNRALRGMRFSRKYCYRCDQGLGLISGFCTACNHLQPGWEICGKCALLDSDSFRCYCDKARPTYEQWLKDRALGTQFSKSLFLTGKGDPLDAENDRERWLEVRRASVSATDINKISLQSGAIGLGLNHLLRSKIEGEEERFFESFREGILREPEIAKRVIRSFPKDNFHHNRFLYAGEDIRHVATPDLIGNGVVGEIKVSTKSMKQIYTKYKDQMQWQMHVTGANKALFIVQNRHTNFNEAMWVPRDIERIARLNQIADYFLSKLESELADDRFG